MRFQILIYNNDDFYAAMDDPDTGAEAMREMEAAHQTLHDELRASGELVDSNELSPKDAVVVRADREAPHGVQTVDGPYAESKEWVGGFYVVDCETRERAAEIAGRLVEARYSPVEIRRVVHVD